MIKAEIITIGDEILIGQIVDSNSAYIAQQLNLCGIKVRQITSVSDSANHIREALDRASEQADVILITGGLGPTKDDITKTVLAAYFGSGKMVVHEPTLDFVEKRLAARGVPMIELNRKQAEVPDNCAVIQNICGTAPGMWFEKDGRIYVSMPGVPYEMKAMLNDVTLRLRKKFGVNPIHHKTMMTYGIAESILAQRIESWENALPQTVSLAYLPSIETGVRLRLTCDQKNGNEIIDALFAELKGFLGSHFYGFEPDTLENILSNLLAGKTLATAESCTGGKIASRVTSVAGSSAYFMGGVVSYSNEAKIDVLGVNPKTIAKHGAVSAEVAMQMAEGVRKKLCADYAVATTGVAGPGGGTPEKPLGLCWFAVATPEKTVVFKVNFPDNSRKNHIDSASSVALNALRLVLTGDFDNPVFKNN